MRISDGSSDVCSSDRGRLRGLGDGRVVVEDVLQPGVRHHGHQVVPDDRLHVEVGAGAQLVEARAGDGVAGDGGDGAVVLDAVSAGRLQDRTSLVWGTSVFFRDDLVGRRIYKKK